jgi:peptidyl-prolyl cis-trans isomerase SurA
MLLRISFLGICIFSLLGLLGFIETAGAANQPLDTIVAVVNNDVILESQLHEAMQEAIGSLRNQHRRMPSEQALRKKVLQSLIMRHLQLQAAKREDIDVSRGEVDSAIQSIAQGNRITPQQLRRAVQSQGVPFAQFRQRVRDEVIIHKLRQKAVASRINVSSRDINLYLENQASRGKSDKVYHISQILVAVPENADSEQTEAARKKARDLLDQLHHGADFSSLAVKSSDGQRAVKGGDLGWLQADALPTFFASVVPHMESGDISDVIHSGGGFHIVKLDGVRSRQEKKVTQYHLQHIMLQPNKVRDAEKTKAQTEDLYEQLQEGASFAKLAETYSDDASSSSQGGDLGWHGAKSLPKPFMDHVTGLEKGQLSQPFHTDSGWHIVKMLGKRKHNTTQQQLRQEAREQIMRRRMTQEYQTYLRKLHNQAYIQLRLDNAPKAQPVMQPGNGFDANGESALQPGNGADNQGGNALQLPDGSGRNADNTL